MSQQDERLSYFTSLCEQLYNPKSNDGGVQNSLEQSFPIFSSAAPTSSMDDSIPFSFGITSPTDTANALRILLETSPSPYVQMFCFSRLKQLVLVQFTLFERETKIQLRTFLLEYAYLHPDLQPFVMIQLAGVFTLVTRLGWVDLEEYQNVYKDMDQFIQTSAEHRIVGLQILGVLIQDMNTSTTPKYSARFRKAAAGLRDTHLLPIFNDAYTILNNLLLQTMHFDKPDQENRTKDATLNLILRCLSYDFAGTSTDEAGEDSGVVQVPLGWRNMYENDDFLSTFFKCYHGFNPPHASKVMECIVQLGSTRKALFSNEQARTRYIDTMMQGIQNIILSSMHMSDSDCFNHFCRLLQRFRVLLATPMETHMEWLSLIAQFTQNAFESCWTPCFYLLSFWSKIVQNMQYLQQLEPEVVVKLEDITVGLARTFISNYIERVPTIIEEMLDDPLDDEESLLESLNMLGQIARCKYEKSCTALVEIFDPIANHYQELIHQADENTLKEAFPLFEARFSWLVYVMGVFIGNRPPYLNSDDCDSADGELITKVIQLLEINQNLQQHSSLFLSEKIDASIVYFFSQYRRSYLGEPNAEAVYIKPNEAFGIEGQTDMLNLIMRKIITNLQCWGESVWVIKRSLELFDDLASGYSALRNIRNIESTQLIMQSHLSNEFSLFSDKHRKSRVLYYQILCKILFADEDDCESEFNDFMKPFELRLQNLNSLDTIEEFQQSQHALLDVFRDLRSFIQPIVTRRHYQMFLNWFYPKYMSVLKRGLETLSPHPEAVVLLKFFGEFVHNKNQRLNLDVSSPQGVLLFRDASQIINTFGQRVINLHITDENQKYPSKYRGIAACFNILARCLGGKYINFGVFWLYQDKAIEVAFNTMFQFMLNIPLDDMMHFPKLSRAYFMMLDEFSVEQMMFTSMMPNEAFLYILEGCEQGVAVPNSWIRTNSCNVINNMCSFVIQENLKKNKRSSWLLNYIHPHLLDKLLSTLFGLILFDDNNDQWQLSRPLYTLVLLERDFASKYTNQVILHQLPERREFVTKVLNNLMEGSGWTLSTKDREKFSQQISTLKRELNNNQIVLVAI